MLKNGRYHSQAAMFTVNIKPLFIMTLILGISGFIISPTKNILDCWKHQICSRVDSSSQSVSCVEGHQLVDVQEQDDVAASLHSEAESAMLDPTGQEEKAEGRIHQIIIETAERYEVDPAIIKAIIMTESSFNPRAESKRGAKGLMQLMPRTAKYLGVVDSFDPSRNVDGGVRYFKKLMNRFDHNIELALAAYNAGSRNVIKYGGIPPFKETRHYVKKVLRYYETYKDSEGLGVEDAQLT